jgi:hypothetical protein
VVSLILKCNINILIHFYEHIVFFFFFYKVLISNSVSSLINGLLEWLDLQFPDSGSAPVYTYTYIDHARTICAGFNVSISCPIVIECLPFTVGVGRRVNRTCITIYVYHTCTVTGVATTRLLKSVPCDSRTDFD